MDGNVTTETRLALLHSARRESERLAKIDFTGWTALEARIENAKLDRIHMELSALKAAALLDSLPVPQRTPEQEQAIIEHNTERGFWPPK